MDKKSCEYRRRKKTCKEIDFETSHVTFQETVYLHTFMFYRCASYVLICAQEKGAVLIQFKNNNSNINHRMKIFVTGFILCSQFSLITIIHQIFYFPLRSNISEHSFWYSSLFSVGICRNIALPLTYFLCPLACLVTIHGLRFN